MTQASAFTPPPLSETPATLLAALEEAEIKRVMYGVMSADGAGVSLHRRTPRKPPAAEAFLTGNLFVEPSGLSLQDVDSGVPIVFVLARGRLFGVVESPDLVKIVGVTSI